MGLLYAKDNKIHVNQYTEIYIPETYFEGNIAVNKGSSVQTFGLLYIKAFPDGNASELKFFNVPVTIDLIVHEFKYETIQVKNKSLSVMTLEFLKDSVVCNQAIPNGRVIAESFLNTVLAGKLPKTLNYQSLLNIWWKNLEISGVSFKVPSTYYELILANIYRNPKNTKQRYGQYYSSNESADGYDYKTGNVRSVVKDLSTFSGMVFEDIGAMITNGINNSAEGQEEPESPLEKIIHY